MSSDLSQHESGVSDALVDGIRKLFRKQLGRFGASAVEILPDEDQDGDPILLVEVSHTLVDNTVDLKDVLAADKAARSLAQAQGERRFLHVRHHFDDRQKLAGAK